MSEAVTITANYFIVPWIFLSVITETILLNYILYNDDKNCTQILNGHIVVYFSVSIGLELCVAYIFLRDDSLVRQRRKKNN